MNLLSYKKKRPLKGLIAGFLGVLMLMGMSQIAQAQNYSIEITPEDTTLNLQETAMFNAYLVDEEGNETDTTFSWSSSNETVATVAGNGMVTALSEGETEISATLGDSSATATLEVESAEESDLPRIVLNAPTDEFEVGDTTQFSAYILLEDSTRKDTTFSWSVSDTTVAMIDSSGNFEAIGEGSAKVIAESDTLSASTEVEVEAADDDPKESGELSIVPEDTVVDVGSMVQYQAIFETDSSTSDTTVQWSVHGQQVGTIDSSGNFTATAQGIGKIRAETNTLAAEATVIVQDSTSDSTGTQTVTIIKPRPSEMAPVDSTTLKEGESYKFGGFPFPYNLLNGGLLHFPNGSLSEDITITIDMPDFANVRGDTVSFENNIVSGISFNVSINDSVRSPYYFREPITVSLPYKRGLIHNVLGITPDQLGMFFYNAETGMDSTGISGTVVDSSSNRIFASVAHFSNVVVAPKSTTTSVEDEPRTDQRPTSFKLGNNYPNPFNPTTSISYTIPSDAKVTLEVFNLLGKRVATLVDARKQSGQHTVRFDASNLSSGVYLYRIKAGSFQAVRKMTLLK